MKKLFYLLLILLPGCATIDKPVEPYRHYRDWCMTCGSKGFLSCELCWSGKTQEGLQCWKCGGSGWKTCPDCYGKFNVNGERK